MAGSQPILLTSIELETNVKQFLSFISLFLFHHITTCMCLSAPPLPPLSLSLSLSLQASAVALWYSQGSSSTKRKSAGEV